MDTIGNSGKVPRYVVITPARNEEDNISHTIESMAAQTVLPLRWIIVNDGSSDATQSIVDDAAKAYAWIKPVHREDRGFRQQGGGVVEAFNDGCNRVKDIDWEFIVKFDADLSFEENYFEQCLDKFSDDPKLGIGGGMISQELDGRLVCESPGDPKFHVRGATKIYSRNCWEAIGGLIQAPGWDTVDELKANMHGFRTYTFRDIPLRHHRYTGAVDGTWKNFVKFGVSNYITGYDPVFMFAKCLKRCFQRPFLVGAIGLGYGFCKSYFSAVRRVDDVDMIRFTREQQWNKLRGKPSLW